MIIVMKPHAKEESIKNILTIIEKNGLEAHLSAGKEVTIIGVIGEKPRLADQNLEIAEDVDKIVAVT